MSIVTDGELRLLLAAIERRTGILHRPDQLESVRETIIELMKDVGIDETEQFIAALETDQSVFDSLADAITVGETYFFREPKHFDFVAQKVVPEFRERFGKNLPLRVWSAACSSGEEPYSLAILFRELNQPANILATDLAPDSIEACRRASYRNWSFRGTALQRVEPYLQPEQTKTRRTLADSIRRRVRFATLNLVADSYPETELGTMHLNLIFCRNVLIYFDPETSQQIARRMAECLAPGGWLITASADMSLKEVPGLTTVNNQWGTFYQKIQPAGLIDTIGERESADHHRPTQLESNSETNDAKVSRPEPVSSDLPLTTALLDQLKSLRRYDIPAALAKVTELADLHPLEMPVHYYHGRLLLESNRVPEAAKAIQKALFLDQSAVMPHFLLGTIQIRRGQWQSAARHLRSAQELCQQTDPDEVIPLSDEMTATETLAAIDSQLVRVTPQTDQ